MAATKYTKSISTDFPNGAVDSSKLTQEIAASAIVTALDYINTSGDDCDIWFKDALSAGDEDVLGVVVGDHDGEPVTEVQPVYSDVTGGLVIASSYTQYDEDAQFKGHRVSCPANTVTILDIPITVETYVNRGKCWFKDANDGDEVEISLVDKNDVLGLFSLFGYTVGQDVLELGKWAEAIPMFPGDSPWTDFSTEDNAPLMAGLFLRVKYDNSHASQDAVMGMVFHWFKGDS